MTEEGKVESQIAETAPQAPDPARTFEAGYGTGKSEGLKEALKALGFADLETAKAAIESSRKAPEQPQHAGAPKATETKEYLELAKAFREKEEAHKAATDRLTSAERRADVARKAQIREVARRVGVGDAQLDDFVRIHGDSIVLDENESLVVLSAMPDGNLVPAGKSAEEFLRSIVTAKPWYLAPVQGRGVGTSTQQNQESNNVSFLKMSFKDRLANSR